MHAFSLRDDVSVCSVRSRGSLSSAAFRRNWSLARRDSRSTIDLSEYSDASTWSDGPGPLSVGDYRLVGEGLQARRTVAEAVIRAEWERQIDAESKLCTTKFGCVGPRTARMCFRVWRRTPAPRPPVMFTWSEVQSLVLLPAGETPPYLILIRTFKLPEEKEWLLQAPTLRARARFAVEIVAAVLRARRPGKGRACDDGSLATCKCCSTGHATSILPEALLMDAARAACEIARLQPSPEGMERLAEVLNLLAKNQQHQPMQNIEDDCTQRVLMPHIPNTALHKFREVVKRAIDDFAEWQQFRLMSQLLQPPPGWDALIWHDHLLPFLSPTYSSSTYPEHIDHQLAIAAERCRRTLS